MPATDYVAPYMGAWIEISYPFGFKLNYESLPTWERGLKFVACFSMNKRPTVAPYMGAWIEIGR